MQMKFIITIDFITLLTRFRVNRPHHYAQNQMYARGVGKYPDVKNEQRKGAKGQAEHYHSL